MAHYDRLVEARILDDLEEVLGVGCDREVVVALGLRSPVTAQVVEDEPVVADAGKLVVPRVRAEGGPVHEDRAATCFGTRLFDEDVGAVVELDRARANPTPLAEALALLGILTATQVDHSTLGDKPRSD